MLRLSSILAGLALMFVGSQAETIVSDNLGNSIGLPMAGGNATGTITNTNSLISTSPYILSVFINNGVGSGNGPVAPGTVESFWFFPPSNAPFYGDATLVSSGFSAGFDSSNLNIGPTPETYLGTPSQPMQTTGLYLFRFTIPVLGSVYVNLTYINAGSPRPVVDLISILVTNPSVVVGDPQFVGLRGQSFQVHGIDGAVYNLISDANTQVNSRFVFLSEGECPMINGHPEPNCWSHPGSYLGDMSFQQIVDGVLHRLLVSSGSAKQGFAQIVLDDAPLSIGDEKEYGSFRVHYVTSHHLSVQTDEFSFELSNSDRFINQAVSNRVPLRQLKSHGLLGQTHAPKIYQGANRYIQGEVDDYVIADNDIFGTDFSFNKFNVQ